MEWRVVLPLLITVVCYIGLGGFLFFVIEGANEQRLREVSNQRNKIFLRDYPCVSSSDFWHLVKRVITENAQGVLAVDNQTIATNWDVISSAYFATTLLTTIGYGHISPLTTTGRLFCVFYALLGIPLTLLLLAGLGSRLARISGGSKLAAFLQPILTMCFGAVIFVLIAAIMFWKVEGWSYSASLYFTFVTLSTIGFGDLVPGVRVDASYRGWYRLVVAVWIFLGLAWLSTTFYMLSDLIKGKYKLKVKKADAGTAETGPVMMVTSQTPAMPLETLELQQVGPHSRRVSMAPSYEALMRQQTTPKLAGAEAEVLRDAVQEALVARAYQEMAAQVVKDMATMDATPQLTMSAAVTSDVTPTPVPAARTTVAAAQATDDNSRKEAISAGTEKPAEPATTATGK